MRYRMKDRGGKADGEAGYVLLAVIFLTVVMLVSLAIAAPQIAKSIQRDKDLETIHRGEQYKRALQLYYRQFGSYPTSIDQLVNTNNVRYLRKRYKDPETGKDDWKPVLYGQAHVRPLGFFGQPLAGVGGLMASATAGGGVAGGMYALAPATTTDANGVPVSDNGSGSSTDGSSSGTGSGPGVGTNSGGSSMNGQSGFGSSSGLGSSSAFGSTSGVGSSSGFGSGMSGQSGLGSSPNSGIGGTTGSSGTSAFGSNSSGSGGTFGGGPIVGFTLTVNKPSLIDYKQQTRYNKWEFNYDPMEEQMQAASGLFGGGSSGTNGTGNGTGPGGVFGGTNPTSPNGQPSTGFGGTTGAGGIGGTSGSGGTSPPTTDPNAPSSPQ